MFTHSVSMLVLMVLSLLGVKYLLKSQFPSLHRGLVAAFKPLRHAIVGLVKRFGLGKCILIMYILFVASYTISIMPAFFRDFLRNVGSLTLLYLPLIAIWQVRRYAGKRRSRRYRLPGRRR